MKKQGFTLIELMVVIVIMGILAAVAVPKLFGMIAKSKASEVGPAAGTYVKLADAYAAEKEEIGNFSQIGYVPPGKVSGNTWVTNTFTYSETLTASTSEVWTATSNGKMNDCASGKSWTVTTTKTGSENTAASGTLTHVAATPDGTSGACGVLTPSFTAIGNSAGSGT